MLEGGEEILTSDEALEEEEIVEEEEGDGEISLHALRGLVNSKTIKVGGNVRNQKPMILINSGSTHSFLDEKIAKKINSGSTHTFHIGF